MADSAWRTRLPAGLLGMLTLMVGIESLIEYRSLETVGPASWPYRNARRSAAADATGCEILAFGDSLLKYSLLPTVLERRQGLRSYNLAVAGAQAPYHYYLLRQVLDGGARPSAVLIEFFPSFLSAGPRLSSPFLSHYLTVGESLELGWEASDPTLLGELLASRLLPSVRCRLAVRDGLAQLVTRRPNSARYENSWLLPTWSKARGAQATHAAPPPAVAPGHWQRLAFPANWTSHPVNDEYLGRFLDLAARHEITVYWVLTPVVPSLQDECERVGFDDRFLAYVHDWQRRFDNLNVIDGRHAAYDPAVYASDPIHLSRDGAYVFSVDLGNVLRRHSSNLDPGRWLTLPAYRHLTADRDIDDDLAARLSAARHPSLLR